MKIRELKQAHPYVTALIEKLARLIDEKTDTKWLDAVDGILYEKGLEIAWLITLQNADPLLIEGVKLLAKTIETGNSDELTTMLTNWVNGKVDIPGIDEAEESFIIKAILATIARSIQNMLSV
jgi:Tfp pilus assembly protein PilN